MLILNSFFAARTEDWNEDGWIFLHRVSEAGIILKNIEDLTRILCVWGNGIEECDNNNIIQ